MLGSSESCRPNRGAATLNLELGPRRERASITTLLLAFVLAMMSVARELIGSIGLPLAMSVVGVVIDRDTTTMLDPDARCAPLM